MLIVVPADPGYGDGLGQVGGTVAIVETGFHDANGAIVLELGFNRPTWLADAAECNHESYLLDVVLPRVLASHNVGRISSLIGYANGGFGALNALLRHPHLFHRVAACDVPGARRFFRGFVRPWGVEEWNPSGDRDVDARHWWHFLDAFPHNAMFAPYNAGTLATCEYVREEMGKSAPGSPRVGLWTGSRRGRWASCGNSSKPSGCRTGGARRGANSRGAGRGVGCERRSISSRRTCERFERDEKKAKRRLEAREPSRRTCFFHSRFSSASLSRPRLSLLHHGHHRSVTPRIDPWAGDNCT